MGLGTMSTASFHRDVNTVDIGQRVTGKHSHLAGPFIARYMQGDGVIAGIDAYTGRSPAIRELETIVSKPPPILCLQNGVGNEESLAAAFGAVSPVSGVSGSVVMVPTAIIEEESSLLMFCAAFVLGSHK